MSSGKLARALKSKSLEQKMIQYGLKMYGIIQAIPNYFPVEQLHLEIKVKNPTKLSEFSMQGYTIPKYFLDSSLKEFSK